MGKLFTRLSAAALPAGSLPFALLFLCLAAYGVLIPYLGFYWDDFPLVWISETMGREGLERYFSTNRPYWGLLFQVTTSVLGSSPLLWQVFALLWRWGAGLALWALLRQVWPQAPRIAAWTALLFTVYPGFFQQFISLVYSHIFIILTVFFLSLLFSILALRRPRFFWPFTAAGLLLSLVNLVSMEYFFLLELVRPLLFWWVIGGESSTRRQRLFAAARAWLPYLAVFTGAGVWRAFFFSFQTQNYQPSLLGDLLAQPIQGLARLFNLMMLTYWDVLVAAWLQIFRLPIPAELGARTTLIYAMLVGSILAAYLLYLALLHRPALEKDNGRRITEKILAQQAVLTGLAACLAAGWPFWLLDLRPTLTFPLDRFTLPFIFGISLLIAGTLQALPMRHIRRAAVLALLIAFAAGWQFQLANTYRRDWETQKRFFWQLSWRIPAMAPGTTLLSSDLPVTYYSDNSLTAPLNWIYGAGTAPGRMDYILFYPSARLGTKIPALQQGYPVAEDYLAARFSGSTSQVVAIDFQPPGCLRVLDPYLDSKNHMLPTTMRYAALLSRTEPVHGEQVSNGPTQLEHLYGPEPDHAWCYYYQKADLARQQEDWVEAASLGDTAFTLTDNPNDPSERIPFIEAYAHTGRWDNALEQTRKSHQVTPLMQPVLCRLWERIGSETSPSPEKDGAVELVLAELECQS